MAKILFYTATAQQFAALENKNPDALYFITDTQQIYKGDVPYTFPVKTVESYPETESAVAGTLYILTGACEAKFFDGEYWQSISLPVVTDLSANVTDQEIPSAKAIQNRIENQADYISFSVFPTDFDIPAGAISEMEESIQQKLVEVYGNWVVTESLSTAIPAQMTSIFNIATKVSDATNADIIVDWGDGSRSVVKNGDYLRILVQNETYGNKHIVMSHTYTVSGKYKVKIYGKDYYALRPQVTPAMTGVEEGTSRNTYNLICDCLGGDHRIASHISNASSMFCDSLRLLKVNNYYGCSLKNISNYASMFADCLNLISVLGVTVKDSCSTNLNNMFISCKNLRECDFQFPPLVHPTSSLFQTFNGCENLERNIEEFFSGNFLQPKMSWRHTFRNCAKITGTVPAHLLWNDPNIAWEIDVVNDSAGINSVGMFYKCSDEIRAQVPPEWGGTNKETVIAPTVQETVSELKEAMTWNSIA